MTKMTKRQRNTKESYTNIWNAAVSAALPQPPKTSQNVPSNSAPALLPRGIAVLLSGAGRFASQARKCNGLITKATNRINTLQSSLK